MFEVKTVARRAVLIGALSGLAISSLPAQAQGRREATGPLLYLERRKYLCALQDAIFGVEGARIVLAKALARMKEEEADRAA